MDPTILDFIQKGNFGAVVLLLVGLFFFRAIPWYAAEMRKQREEVIQLSGDYTARLERINEKQTEELSGAIKEQTLAIKELCKYIKIPVGEHGM